MLTKRRVVAAKVETTEGTAETLTASEGGILAIDPKVDVDIAMHERTPAKASLGRLTSLAGSRKASISFKVEVKGAGIAYSATDLPALDVYLMACGVGRALVVTPGSETVTYAPASTGVSSITIGCYEDGVLKMIKGARGNCRITMKQGEPVMMEFEFTGVHVAPTDVALLAPTYESTIPPIFRSATFTVASYAAIMSAINIDFGNSFHLRESVNTAEGFVSNVITDRNMSGDMDPEMVLVATHDWYGIWLAGTTGALAIGSIGSAQYNKFTITAPKLLATKVSDDDAEGQVKAGQTFQLAENSGDDEISILFD